MAVFFRLHFAYRIQRSGICVGGRLGARWTQKQRVIAGIGWVLGGTAVATIRLLIYVGNLAPWPWLRNLFALVLLSVSYMWWLWPTLLAIAGFHEFLLRNDKRRPRERHFSDAAPATDPQKSYSHPHRLAAVPVSGSAEEYEFILADC
jgi:hypothetical protein